METIQMENLKTNSKKATKKISLFSWEHPPDLTFAYIEGNDHDKRNKIREADPPARLPIDLRGDPQSHYSVAP
jgi:hypothetical protein